MAPVAIPAKVTAMPIVPVMAGKAGSIQFFPFREGLCVTGLAAKAFVPAFQWILGLLFVIEKPELPSVRGVALAALLTKRPFVDVVHLVAGEAAHLGVLVCGRQMTLLAGQGAVLPDQRKP